MSTEKKETSAEENVEISLDDLENVTGGAGLRNRTIRTETVDISQDVIDNV